MCVVGVVGVWVGEVGVWYWPSSWSIGERGAGVGGEGGVGLLVGLEEGEIIERDVDLPLSCIVWFALLRLEETAATGVATAAESAEIVISLTVSAVA